MDKVIVHRSRLTGQIMTITVSEELTKIKDKVLNSPKVLARTERLKEMSRCIKEQLKK
jgi:hypothetical protein